ncbi:carbohydrate kinase family protein [Candidatus Saccharibacteria bacterium]|nr:carbohydrate kinase family protein [Candidatus Saccharibacteria bacterium]
MARIVAVGSALQDIYLVDRDDFVASQVGDISIFGEIAIGTKVDIDNISFEVGGGGTNAAVSFARHGHEAIFMGNIGHDSAGEAVLEALDKEGIDSSYVSYAGKAQTGCSIILLDIKSGERTILTHRGASARFDNLDENDLELIKPDWLYVSTVRGDMDMLLRFFEKAHELGIKIMFNPGKLELEQKKKLLGLLEDVDVLLVNKVEAAQIVPGKVLAELLSHLANYVKTVIITDGAMGAIATDGRETYRFGIYEDVRVKDTTGAGDAFGSGFLAHLAAGKSFEESLVFGSANSTSVVQQLGAKAGILTGDEDLHPMPIQRV